MYELQKIALERLLGIMDRLRAECPWDRKQTFDTLRKNTIEETFELTDAISDGDLEEIRAELGDLLLHIVFYSKLGEEQQAFGFAEVANGICDKLIYRHPHVFGDVSVQGAEQVVQNWEDLKLREGRKKHGVLSGVPRSLPALVKAYRIGEKAAAAGFDWEKREDVWDKVREETAEVEAEIAGMDTGRMEGEIGDLLFALVNMARLYDVDPEAALEKTNKKFIRRFGHIEAKAAEAGKALRDCSLAELEAWWQDAKKEEGPNPSYQ